MITHAVNHWAHTAAREEKTVPPVPKKPGRNTPTPEEMTVIENEMQYYKGGVVNFNMMDFEI